MIKCKLTKVTLSIVQIYCTTLSQPKNVTNFLQAVNFTGLLQLVNRSQQTCQFHQVATSMLKSGSFNLSFADLLQLVLTTSCGKPVENKF